MKWLIPPIISCLIIGNVSAQCRTFSRSYVTPYVAPTKIIIQKKVVAYPVAQFVGVPIPVLGSFYVGPSNVQYYAKNPCTQTAMGYSPPPVNPAIPNNTKLEEAVTLFKQGLTEIKTTNTRLTSLETRLALMEKSLAELRKGPAPPPPDKSAPKEMDRADELPPAKEDKELGDIQIWNNSCGKCHMRGNHVRNKGTPKEKEGFVIMEDRGKRATLTAKQMKRMLEVLTDGSMPPPDNVHKIPALTDKEVSIAIVGLTKFPVKE